MKIHKRLRNQLFRWRALIIATSTFAPFLILCVLGVIWLFEQALLFEFVLITATLGLALALINFLLSRPLTPKQLQQNEQVPHTNSEVDIEADPDWNDKETEIFTALCKSIHQQTRAAIPWQQLSDAAINVVTEVATSLKGTNAKPLDFSAAEALLLVEQTAKRYRQHLRNNMPFTDQISIAQIRWLWRNRKNLTSAWRIADGSRRLARLATNPSGALVKELELLMSGGQSQYVSDQLASTLQTLLLEEIAASAIDLYSGRLRFSEQELHKLALTTTKQDEARFAEPDDPLRILIIGQISAGKSSLINHLIDDDLAEIDPSPTTSSLATYPGQICGTACYFIDTPGLSGESSSDQNVINEITQSDMVIWLMRADRPAKSVDAALATKIEKWHNDNPTMRMPPIIPVLTHIDRLCPSWPYPEHDIPTIINTTINEACHAASHIINDEQPVAISNKDPAWHLHVLYQKISDSIYDAAMTQKNRKRLAGDKQHRSLKHNVKRNAKGLYAGARALGSKWLSKK